MPRNLVHNKNEKRKHPPPPSPRPRPYWPRAFNTQAIDDGLIDTSRSMHVGIRGSVNDHEDIVADEELVREGDQTKLLPSGNDLVSRNGRARSCSVMYVHEDSTNRDMMFVHVLADALFQETPSDQDTSTTQKTKP